MLTCLLLEQQQKSTAVEQLQARRKHEAQSATACEPKQAGDVYAECYPAAYELDSFWDFRATDKESHKGDAQRAKYKQSAKQMQQHRDHKIARDMNKLEQGKRNARERGDDDAPGGRPSKKAHQ